MTTKTELDAAIDELRAAKRSEADIIERRAALARRRDELEDDMQELDANRTDAAERIQRAVQAVSDAGIDRPAPEKTDGLDGETVVVLGGDGDDDEVGDEDAGVIVRDADHDTDGEIEEDINSPDTTIPDEGLPGHGVSSG